MNAKTTALLAVFVAVFASAVFIMDAGDSEATTTDTLTGQGFNHATDYDMTVEYHVVTDDSEQDSTVYYLKIALTAINTNMMVNVAVGNDTYGPFPASTSFNVFLAEALTGSDPITVDIKEAKNSGAVKATCDLVLAQASTISLVVDKIGVDTGSEFGTYGKFSDGSSDVTSVQNIMYGSVLTQSNGILTITDKNGGATVITPVPLDDSGLKFASAITNGGWYIRPSDANAEDQQVAGQEISGATKLVHKFTISYIEYTVVSEVLVDNITSDVLDSNYSPGTVPITGELTTVHIGDNMAIDSTTKAITISRTGSENNKVITPTPNVTVTKYSSTFSKWYINSSETTSATAVTAAMVGTDGKITVSAEFEVDYGTVTITINKVDTLKAIESLKIGTEEWSETTKTFAVRYNSVAKVNGGVLTFVSQASNTEKTVTAEAKAAADGYVYGVSWSGTDILIGQPITANKTFTVTGERNTPVLSLSSTVWVKSGSTYSQTAAPTVALNNFVYTGNSAILKITPASGHAYTYELKAIAFGTPIDADNVGTVGTSIPVISTTTDIVPVKQNGSIWSINNITQAAEIVVICTEVNEAGNVKQFYVSDIGEATIGAVIESKDAAFDAGEIRLSYSYYRTIGGIEGYGSADKVVLNCTSDKDYNGTAIALTETTPTLTSGSYHDMAFTAIGTVYAAKALYGTTSGTFSPVAETLWVFAGVKDI